MARTNIREIAEKAGVSTASVSYVLNGRAGVSQETRERILRVIREENYTPNVNSRRLVLRRSYNLLLVMDAKSPMSNMFYSNVTSRLMEASAKRGYSLVLASREEEFGSSAAFQALRQSNADGLIFFNDLDERTRLVLEQEKTPFVVIDSHKTVPDCPCVRADYRMAVYTATRYLIGLGHRRLGFLGRGDIADYYVATFEGFREALAEADLILDPLWLFSDATDMESARACAARLLAMKSRPTAMVCTGDLLAIAAMTRAQESGVCVPGELSFVSVDDLPVSRIYYPALTTVQIDTARMAEWAMEIMEAQIGDAQASAPCLTRTIPSTNLQIRASATAPVLDTEEEIE